MFAFALWDERAAGAPARPRPVREEAALLRARSGGRCIFGSELKSLLEHPSCPTELDLESLSRYLALEYVPTPYSIFAGVRKLPGGPRAALARGPGVDRAVLGPLVPARSERCGPDDDEYAEELPHVSGRRCGAA